MWQYKPDECAGFTNSIDFSDNRKLIVDMLQAVARIYLINGRGLQRHPAGVTEDIYALSR
jgi:hypothetical protein